MIEIEKEFGIFFDYWDFQSEYGNMTDRLMMIGDQEAAYVSEPQREEFKVLEEALKSKEEILEQTRRLIQIASQGDPDAWFEINQWVYARLQLDERRKKPKKSDLYNKQRGLCHLCKKEIEDLKEADIHRLDDTKWYDDDNSVLVHRICHQRTRTK